VLGPSALKPEPVPLDVKVVVIGDRSIYDLLYRYDTGLLEGVQGARRLSTRSCPPRSPTRGTSFRSCARSRPTRPVADGSSGMVAMLEEAVRQGRWHRRFSSRFSDLADLQREASHLARCAGAEQIDADHVAAARDAYERRHGLTEDRTHD